MDNLEEILEELIKMKNELYSTYLGHFVKLTELGAPAEVFAMLDAENDRVMNKVNQAIKNAEFAIATKR